MCEPLKNYRVIFTRTEFVTAENEEQAKEKAIEEMENYNPCPNDDNFLITVETVIAPVEPVE